MAKRGVVESARSGSLRYLRERSIVEGVLNGRKPWLALGAVLLGLLGVRRAMQRTERIVLHEALKPGDQLVITQIARETSRRKRRKAG
jgi:hypothetical protein